VRPFVVPPVDDRRTRVPKIMPFDREKTRIIWITGAGRSGTHMAGMLADGHPEVNAFPVEFPMVRDWLRLLVGASMDNQALPGRFVDERVASHYLVRPEIGRAVSYPIWQFIEQGDPNPVRLTEYLDTVNRRLFGHGDRAFLFHSPGCQIDMLAGTGAGPLGDRVRVLLLLRHPVQNYLAWVEHLLQKGRGYRPPDKVRSHPGLPTILHLALSRVLRAFQAAGRWKNDSRVVVTRLEDFTVSPEERQRVWRRLGLSVHPCLESLSRHGKAAEAHSGKWRKTTIQPVAMDLYDPVLTAEEARVFETCAEWFRPFYPDPLASIHVPPRPIPEDLLRERERKCLTRNLEADRKRRERLTSLLREPPRDLKEAVQWPARALYTLLADGLFYPRIHLARHRRSVRNAVDGLEMVPSLLDLGMDRLSGEKE